MGEVIDLAGRPAPLVENDELIADLARFADGTLTEQAVKSRHRLSEEDWAAMGEDDGFVRAVEAEKLRRIRSGQTKRELAQNEIIAAPPILGKIMRSPDSNARHVIDAVKTLDTLVGTEAAAAAATRFSIVINLTADGGDHIERFNKSIAVDPNDTDPDADITDVVAAIATNKKDDGGGQGHI
jgi:hypothetical protein